MSTTLYVIIAVLLFAGCAAVVAIAADRSARAEAWRKIAEERRWNWDHRDDDSTSQRRPE